jgi:transcriptional regulator with XRE-family HTH domain
MSYITVKYTQSCAWASSLGRGTQRVTLVSETGRKRLGRGRLGPAMLHPLPRLGNRVAQCCSALGPLTRDGSRSVGIVERVMSTAEAGGEHPFSGLDDPSVDATVLRMLLGSQLRRLREAAGITPEQAGYEIRASRSKISRLENGRVGLKSRDMSDLLTLYGVTDEALRSRFLTLVQQANTPDWWTKYSDILPDWFETYLGLEAAAATIRSFEVQFVHGLFQTGDYARAVTRRGRKSAPADEIERRVALRLKRQELLSRPNPPRIWSLMDEAVLRRPVGGPALMRAQFQHLIEVAELPQVTLQVVPFASGVHPGESGSFTVLRFQERDLPDVVYLEQLTGAIYLDQRSDVEHYLEVVDELSSEALTPAETTRFIEQIAREA